MQSGALTVRLSDLAAAGTYLIADGVRIERVGDLALPPGPYLQLLDTAAAVADGGSVDFGRTDPWTPLTRTFAVRNAGTATAALTLGAISLPAGFSLAAGFGQATLAPGQSTTFAVRLDAAAVGVYSGAVRFATNDPAHPDFTFAVTGTTSVVSYLDDGGAGFSATPGWQPYSGAGWHGDLFFK